MRAELVAVNGSESYFPELSRDQHSLHRWKRSDRRAAWNRCMMLAMAAPGHESESEQWLGIIDSVPALIHTARPDGYLDYFNQRWLDYVGVPMQALLGWMWTAAIHPEDVEAIVNKWRSSIATDAPFLDEARVRRAD